MRVISGTERSDLPGLELGTVVDGKYKIEGRLGSGGMGVVYEATHIQLRKRVAIKMLAPDLAQREDLIARVIREARSASATGHPNVALVTDLGWLEGTPFLVMELVVGETLEDRILNTGPMPVPRAANITCQILDGLQAVHDVGIIHRDLKPSNVMLVQDRRRGLVVKLLDFGISKLSEPDPEDQGPALTRPGAIMGTPRHMAPEQVLGDEDIDHRADIHSVGSLLYWLLVGRAPFRAGNATATMAKVLHGDYEPPTTVIAGLPRELDEIVGKAMAIKREHRFQSADAMRRALQPFANVKRAESTEGPGAGPPRVGEDGLALEPEHLPPLAAVSGTEVGTGSAWPSAAGRALGSPLPGTVLPVGDPSLELDVPTGWRPGQDDRPADGKMPTRGGSTPWGVIAVVAVLSLGVWAAWSYRSEIEATASSVGGESSKGRSRGKPGEVVLLMVKTTPKDAIVFVDDVQHAERPISIPKTGEYVKLRIEAEGYESRVMQIEAKASRRLEIKLDRTPRRRR